MFAFYEPGRIKRHLENNILIQLGNEYSDSVPQILINGIV